MKSLSISASMKFILHALCLLLVALCLVHGTTARDQYVNGELIHTAYRVISANIFLGRYCFWLQIISTAFNCDQLTYQFFFRSTKVIIIIPQEMPKKRTRPQTRHLIFTTSLKSPMMVRAPKKHAAEPFQRKWQLS